MTINKLLTKVNYENVNDLKRIKYIVIHYVGATGGAKDNCLYFQNTYREASAHYFVGHGGEVWQCVDDADVAWHCGASTYKHKECRNSNSIGIEMCCRQGADGKWYFEDATVNSTIELTKTLMKKYNVPASNVIRHYDVTGKTCPEPYVTNRTKHTWDAFKSKLVVTPRVECTGKINGYNIIRQTDYLVIYDKGANTNTNQYGTEVAVDSNGIATCAPVYGKGKMTIPSGGYVISGHGSASDWIKANIKKGSQITINNGSIKVGAVVSVPKFNGKVSGYNVIRQSNYLVIYDKGSKTGTNKWGTEVAVNASGTVVTSPVYGVGNMAIPSGCYVISGHGVASDWIKANIKKGDKVSIVGGFVKVGVAPSASSGASNNTSNSSTLTTGSKLQLSNAPLYSTAYASTNVGAKSGTYYVWNNETINNRIRITNSSSNVGKTGQITGWINVKDAKVASSSSASSAVTTVHPYMVKTTKLPVKIYKGAGTNYGTNGTISKAGSYTIVKEANGIGASKWLYLKSGAGWISNDYVTKV